MKLREGVKFSDGTMLNASSLKYQVDWTMDKKNGAWTRGWLKPVKSVEIVDEYTVKWRFKQPWVAFLGIMANIPGYMLSEKALKADLALSEVERAEGKVKKARKKLVKAEGKTKNAAGKGGQELEKAEKAVKKARKALTKAERI
jgi:ABC-type transport system substrate-binding protein